MDIPTIKSIETFQDVPEGQLEWLIAQGETMEFETGDHLFTRGQPSDHMFVVERGGFRIYLPQGKETRVFGEIVAGEISGLLPYSRMEVALGTGTAKEPSSVFAFHRKYFPEMIRDHYELTAALVHHMTNRVRSFTSQRLQNEKLMSLGKLSAGLAHELNNPASAIVRSSSALKDHLQLVPEAFKQVIKIQATDEQIDAVNNMLFQRLSEGSASTLSLMEKNEREDELAEWLEDRGVEDGYEMAGMLVEFGFAEADLESVGQHIQPVDLPSVLKWIGDNLTTEKMVQEISEAAFRISELVQAVKGYTHMDRARAMQAVDLHPGLVSTLTMLKHKIRQNQIEVVQEFAPDLHPVEGFPGQLNQIFTNLIDNAVDAMESGGKLTLRTRSDAEFVYLEVEDTGSGIPPENLSQIFDPFYTTKEMGKGTGMGLDVVNKIVTQHKGNIEVESKPGRTVFKLCFPAHNN